MRIFISIYVCLCAWLCVVTDKAAAANDDCPVHLPRTPNLIQVGGFCYEFILDGEWRHAYGDCISKQGKLADVEFERKSDLEFIINSTQTLRESLDDGVWIGFLNDELAKWIWVPGAVAGNYTDYNDCPLKELDGLWHLEPCEGHDHAWVCKYEIVAKED